MPNASGPAASLDDWSTVEAVVRSHDPDLVAKIFFEEAERHGFTAAALGVVRPASAGDTAPFFYSNWPGEWLRLYEERDFLSRDVAVQAAKQSMHPFAVSEVVERIRPSRAQREILEEGRCFGWLDALVVPMHGPGG